MVNLVLVINSKAEYRTLMWNYNILSNCEYDCDVLCVVTEKNIYTKCRDWLNDNIDRGEVLTVYLQRDRIDEIKTVLTEKNEYTFLIDCGSSAEPGMLRTLIKNYRENFCAGLIACDRDDAPPYYVQNVYDKYEVKNKIPLKDFAEIDVVSWNGILTKTDILKKYFENIQTYGDLSYSVQLRRLGFSNFVNNKLKLGGIK